MATTEAATRVRARRCGAEPEFPPHRMTIDRYERLVEAGVYGADDPVFLWKGRLVEKMTKGDPHAFAVDRASVALLVRLVPDGWSRPSRSSRSSLGDDSMPEPDLAVVRGSLRDYLERTPTARDVALVVEVSDSSLAHGFRDEAAGPTRPRAIPVYWIVNIPKRRIEVYGRPDGAGRDAVLSGATRVRPGRRGPGRPRRSRGRPGRREGDPALKSEDCRSERSSRAVELEGRAASGL